MDDVGEDSSGVNIVTRLYIFNLAKACEANSFAKKLDLVEKNLLETISLPPEEKDSFLIKFCDLKSKMKTRWQKANRIEKFFLEKNCDWLEGNFEIPKKVVSNVTGRPQKCFEDLCERSKRRKTEPLRQGSDANELLFAGQMILREKGNISGANVVKNIITSPTRGEKYEKAFKKSDTPSSSSNRQLSPVQALSMFVEASLSRKQYEIVRTSDKKLYPCYTILQKAKKECYPPQEALKVTASYAEVQLQSLLNHTVARLLLYLDDVLDTLSSQELASLELICKWGCDGSQQNQFKQKFENCSDSDAHIFQSSMVPLRLYCKTNNKTIWQNPTPSSPRFCRPMRIRFVHETKDITTEEINYFQNQIKELQVTKSFRGTIEIVVAHKMIFTMVDGKVCNAATGTASTMRCYICKATSKDFNDLTKVKEVNVDNLEFGLSVLHARIRFFETLLHLSYKLPTKRWQARSQADKDSVKERKAIIQEKFRTELGLIVDVPKPGFGTSNDGNTSRRFFSNTEVSAQITGIDKLLIEKFAVVLEVLSSGYKINNQMFSEYCKETAQLYVQLYSWHPMTPTVHKVLIHGPLVIQHALLPIGTLSEEAAEARNKHFRLFRQNYSRKFSREECNMDIINRLLLTSDPFLSNIRPKPEKRSKSFSSAAMQMLLPFEPVNNDAEHENFL